MIVFNHPLVSKFASDKIGEEEWGQHFNIGRVVENELVAACILNHATGLDIYLHLALADRHSMSKEFVKAVFSACFNDLQCVRVSTAVPVSTDAHSIVKHFGFKEEGIKRRGAGDEDLIMYGMLKEECRFV